MKRISSFIIIILLLTLINSCKQKSSPSATDNPVDGIAISNLSLPTWADTMLHDPEIWGLIDDTSYFDSLIVSISSDEYHPEILEQVILRISKDRLMLVESVLFALADMKPKTQYIELGKIIENRAIELGTEYHPVMLYSFYDYDEVGDTMLQIILADRVDPFTRIAASRWLRETWQQNPFPSALMKAIQLDLSNELDSTEYLLSETVLGEERLHKNTLLFYLDLLLTMKTIELLDSDETLHRLNIVESKYSEPIAKDRITQIRETCGG